MGLCHKARRMLRAFAWDRPLGQLARLPLRLIPRDLALPVLSVLPVLAGPFFEPLCSAPCLNACMVSRTFRFAAAVRTTC